jgi:hypothetical protein
MYVCMYELYWSAVSSLLLSVDDTPEGVYDSQHSAGDSRLPHPHLNIIRNTTWQSCNLRNSSFHHVSAVPTIYRLILMSNSHSDC